MILYNVKTGQAEYLKEFDGRVALQRKTHEVPLISPVGEKGSAPVDVVSQLLSEGYRQPDQDEIEQMLQTAANNGFSPKVDPQGNYKTYTRQIDVGPLRYNSQDIPVIVGITILILVVGYCLLASNSTKAEINTVEGSNQPPVDLEGRSTQEVKGDALAPAVSLIEATKTEISNAENTYDPSSNLAHRTMDEFISVLAEQRAYPSSGVARAVGKTLLATSLMNLVTLPFGIISTRTYTYEKGMSAQKVRSTLIGALYGPHIEQEDINQKAYEEFLDALDDKSKAETLAFALRDDGAYRDWVVSKFSFKAKLG